MLAPTTAAGDMYLCASPFAFASASSSAPASVLWDVELVGVGVSAYRTEAADGAAVGSEVELSKLTTGMPLGDKDTLGGFGAAFPLD